MPIVQVKMLAGCSLERKRGPVREVTRPLVHTIGTTSERVNVLIEEYEPEHWAFANQLFAERILRSEPVEGA